jgi:HD-GYP domain-containing protein (c-di-GMP phosphodiesterase class II)/pSer/pThr/pTyr-binding forkhead associated (FHA) protein
MPILRVKAGTNKGKYYEIADESLVIGREVADGVQVMDQGVSRRHAEIFRIGEMYFIRDLESRNGTFVNDKTVNEHLLRLGDQIRVGNTILVFEDRQARLRDSSRIVDDDGAQAQAPNPTSTIHLRLSNAVEKRPPGDGESRESRNLNILFHLGYIVSEEKDLSRLLNRAAELIGRSLEADHLFILWSREEGESFEILGRYDRSGEDPDSGYVSRTILKDCLKFGRSVLTSDATLDKQFNAMASIVMKQLRSVMCVPIHLLGKTVGVLYVYSKRPEAFSSDDLETASAAGIELGTTIGLLTMIRNSDRFFRDSIRTLVSAIDMRNPGEKGKAERVATYALAIAKELGLETHDLRNAWLAGMLHDVGSIPLTDKERGQELTLETKKNHYARDLLKGRPGVEAVLPAITEQNERFDGSGSPEGKKGREISILGRVLGLALELDGLLYHGSAGGEEMTVKEALLKIKELADRQFDRETINALLIAYRNGKLFNQDEEFFEVPLS